MNFTPNLAKFLAASALAMILAVPCAPAQAADEAAKQGSACTSQSGPMVTRTFYLANTNTDNRLGLDGSELLSALRNILCPGDKVNLVPAQSAVVVQASPDQLALAEKLIADLDRPRKTYRLVYTITELEAGKPVGTQHFSMVVVSGQHTAMKEGDKIPVATGLFSGGNSSSQTEFQYLDIGMNFDATVVEVAGGVRLQSKVEQSSVGQSSTIAGVQEPVVRQTVVEGTSFLSLGKPVMLGSVDVPNSTRHFDIAVVLEQVK